MQTQEALHSTQLPTESQSSGTSPLTPPPSDMNNLIQFVTTQDWVAWVGAATALLTAVIAVASLIPGDEPEATLTKIVSFLSKFSKK